MKEGEEERKGEKGKGNRVEKMGRREEMAWKVVVWKRNIVLVYFVW